MALLRILTAAAFAKLSAPLQAEYKKDAEGDNYTLDLTDYEDVTALKTAKDREVQARKDAAKLAKELQASLDALTEERDGMLRGSIPKADAEKLEKSWKDKLTNREKELQTQIDAANGTLQTLLVDNVAAAVANDISTAPAVMLPHVKGRLRAEKNAEGKYETRVVDKDGKPSALTVEDLKKEFSLHPDFKTIITASKASGGGAGGGGGGGGAGNAGKGEINWKGSPSEIAAALRTSGKIKAD